MNTENDMLAYYVTQSLENKDDLNVDIWSNISFKRVKQLRKSPKNFKEVR
jgi:hypothetical protein